MLLQDAATKKPIRVLFVCLGNICRSPMAEAVFQHHVRDAGLGEAITTDSAGTGHWHVGEPPHAETRRLLRENHIAYEHCARQLTPGDLHAFDYVVTMDEANWRDVQDLGAGSARVVRLMDFAPESGVREVPDPYYTGGFAGVYALVKAATAGLLAAIRRDHGL